jgi:hypothetical protein
VIECPSFLVCFISFFLCFFLCLVFVLSSPYECTRTPGPPHWLSHFSPQLSQPFFIFSFLSRFARNYSNVRRRLYCRLPLYCVITGRFGSWTVTDFCKKTWIFYLIFIFGIAPLCGVVASRSALISSFFSTFRKGSRALAGFNVVIST